MIRDLSIIEDAIPRDFQDRIEGLLLGTNFSWYLQNEANYQAGQLKQKIESETKTKDTFQFFHIFYEHDQVRSIFLNDISPLLDSLHPIKSLVRIKSNLTVLNMELGNHGLPHVDQICEGIMTAIYYVNDSTGETFIFNEEWKEEGSPPDFSKLTVKQTIIPKKGRLVVFKGSLMHSGNCPKTNRPRAVINFNFIPKETV